LLNSLTLGNQHFPINIIQGPLAGISCAPFRALTWRYSMPAFSCTEMITCKTLLHAPLKLQQRFVQKDPQEGPVCFQLSSNDPVELAEAVKKVTDLGADLIDLNCGCPVRKIRKKGAGSRLLTDASTLYQLIRAMKNNTHLPVSIKIRVESAEEKFNQDVANAISDAGADFLVVHGRHWTEHYETACRHEEIQFFVEALKIPVIGNGDIADLASLQKMFATGCSGVMIARAGVGQPWLIAKLIAEMRQEPFSLPSNPEIGAVFLEHIQRLATLLGNDTFAMLQGRQFAKYYGRHLPNRAEFVEKVNSCSELAVLETLCRDYFGT
jgi:tRNA-dihydrouridine synthase B